MALACVGPVTSEADALLAFAASCRDTARKMTAMEREAVLLALECGAGYAEVGAALGISRQAAYEQYKARKGA